MDFLGREKTSVPPTRVTHTRINAAASRLSLEDLVGHFWNSVSRGESQNLILKMTASDEPLAVTVVPTSPPCS